MGWHGVFENIRIYHKCEGRIEKSVLRITIWHQEVAKTIILYDKCEGRIEKSVPWIRVCYHRACRVMTNDDPEGQIFLSYPHMNNGFFFLLTTVCFLKEASRRPYIW